MEYTLEIDKDGNLICVTEYQSGFYTEWTITSIVMVDSNVYFVSL